MANKLSHEELKKILQEGNSKNNLRACSKSNSDPALVILNEGKVDVENEDYWQNDIQEDNDVTRGFLILVGAILIVSAIVGWIAGVL